MFHNWLGQDDTVECISCGATYFEYSGDGWEDICSRTGEQPTECLADRIGYNTVHGYDTSAHSLDGCIEYDDTGECMHLAVLLGCNCLHCTG